MANSMIDIGHAIRNLLITLPSPRGGNLRAYAPDEIPMSFNEFPVAIILPGVTDYHADFNSDVDMVFRIILLISSADQPSSLSFIMPYIEIDGEYSIKALFGNTAPQTLGGTCDDSHLNINMGFGNTVWGSPVPYLSTEFSLQVWA